MEILIQLTNHDIVGLSEHFLRQVELDTLCFPGFSQSSGFCRSQMRKGGVCILSRDSLQIQPVDVSSFCLEGICDFTSVKFDMSDITYIILDVYRPTIYSKEEVNMFLTPPLIVSMRYWNQTR